MSKVLQMAARYFGIDVEYAFSIMQSASHRYKVYKIPKRQAGKFRTIAQPAKEVKMLQRWLVQEVICDLPVHDAATAYREGHGIKVNAERHLQNAYLLKMDFEKFFPSIKEGDLTAHIEKYLPRKFSAQDIDLICRVALWKPKRKQEFELSIGGPSSPFISNSIVYDFDALVSDACANMNVTYTRYADDLAFSTNEKGILKNVEGLVAQTCEAVAYPPLRINAEKTVHSSKKHRRFVTGITLSSQGKLSLGRDRKRTIRAMIHRAINGLLSADETASLKGLLAFALDVEPQFVESMRTKYGAGQIEALLKWVPPNRK